MIQILKTGLWFRWGTPSVAPPSDNPYFRRYLDDTLTVINDPGPQSYTVDDYDDLPYLKRYLD